MSGQRGGHQHELTFTGERLHEEDALFGVDLVRHQVAYQHAIRIARERGARKVLELGSGTGYGTAELASALPEVIAIDRIAPLATGRTSSAHFVRADLAALPLASARFDLTVSFQVIEHLPDPTGYLDAIARHLDPAGVALITTPNRLQSDGENPFHVHEYVSEELAARLAHHFAEVEMLAISLRGEAARYQQERLRRIRRIVRLDPLGLRKMLPSPLAEWLFARAARLVRRGIAAGEGIPEVGYDDFPIGPADPGALDLMAVCSKPIARGR